ncbi:MAG: hypothetical protein ACRDVZ_12180 [Jiangellaceae bacterium]
MSRDKRPRSAKASGGKTPKSPVAAHGKIPVATERTGPDMTLPLRFRFNQVDVGGPWCLTKIEPDHHADLLHRMRAFETMTASEVFHGRDPVGKHYDMSHCPNQAPTARLAEEYDGRDDVCRLQINGKRRLYGFLTGNDFSIVWWDPEHEIWPSTKRHT